VIFINNYGGQPGINVTGFFESCPSKITPFLFILFISNFVAIKLPSLEQIAQQYTSNKNFVYKDLHLDFATSDVYNPSLGRSIKGNDIKVEYDENAIKNSLRNLFNTKPGQRFLFPLYGLDLNQFLFEAITPINAQLIGEKIAISIDKFEPRVTLLNVNVVADFDNNLYEIDIVVQIPVFNTTTTINTTLDARTQSFIFLNTPRNI
jgi:phage baseplate assembly protein W